jgi:hypothetical protein
MKFNKCKHICAAWQAWSHQYSTWLSNNAAAEVPIDLDSDSDESDVRRDAEPALPSAPSGKRPVVHWKDAIPERYKAAAAAVQSNESVASAAAQPRAQRNLPLLNRKVKITQQLIQFVIFDDQIMNSCNQYHCFSPSGESFPNRLLHRGRLSSMMTTKCKLLKILMPRLLQAQRLIVLSNLVQSSPTRNSVQTVVSGWINQLQKSLHWHCSPTHHRLFLHKSLHQSYHSCKFATLLWQTSLKPSVLLLF